MRIMPTPLKLSVLDQSPSAQDRTQDCAIRESLALARHCDALGYHRYWVSEHHDSASIVGTAPEVLMAAVAATTQRIRVGSAGVMLPHYSTLKVAEQFRVLEAIAPGRIDLGVGRAPGSDRTTAMALNPDLGAAEHFPVHVQELDLWLRGEPFPPGHPFREIHAHPTEVFFSHTPETMREELRRKLDLAGDCRLDLNLNDIHSINGNPDTLTRWAQTALELSEEYGAR